MICNGPEHVKHVIGGMFPGGSLLRVCSVDQSIVIISVQLLSRVRLFASITLLACEMCAIVW